MKTTVSASSGLRTEDAHEIQMFTGEQQSKTKDLKMGPEVFII